MLPANKAIFMKPKISYKLISFCSLLFFHPFNVDHLEDIVHASSILLGIATLPKTINI